MKTSNLLLILAVTMCVAAGCKKDDPNGGSLKIEAKVVNGKNYNDLIDEVRVITRHAILSVQPTEIASCKYKNGGFSFTLPEKVIGSAYTYNNGIAMTNSIYASFFAYKNDEYVGQFAYTSSDSTQIVKYYYAYHSGTVSVTLSRFDGIFTELEFEDGWNTVYYTKGEQGYPASFTKPKEKLNWYFIPRPY